MQAQALPIKKDASGDRAEKVYRFGKERLYKCKVY